MKSMDCADNKPRFLFWPLAASPGLALGRTDWGSSGSGGGGGFPPDEAAEPICWAKKVFTLFLINLNGSRPVLWQPALSARFVLKFTQTHFLIKINTDAERRDGGPIV